MKLPLENLNPSFCPLHPTSTYTCKVTTEPRMRGGDTQYKLSDT